MNEPIAMCFSGGKDSAMALHHIRGSGEHRVVVLLTTVTDTYDRVSMHGVRRELLREQADAIGVPLTEIVVPARSSNAIYEQEMGKAFSQLHANGIRRVAFGDIFLEDLRDYRERQLATWSLKGLFPLWKQPTADLALAFIRDGFRAITVCVNPAALDAAFAGRPFNEAFLADLHADIDPCGENGEFHTFVFDGPIFTRPIAVSRGVAIERDDFVFCDLISQPDGAGMPRNGSNTGGFQ